jgi:hypothetical protein
MLTAWFDCLCWNQTLARAKVPISGDRMKARRRNKFVTGAFSDEVVAGRGQRKAPSVLNFSAGAEKMSASTET